MTAQRGTYRVAFCGTEEPDAELNPPVDEMQTEESAEVSEEITSAAEEQTDDVADQASATTQDEAEPTMQETDMQAAEQNATAVQSETQATEAMLPQTQETPIQQEVPASEQAVQFTLDICNPVQTTAVAAEEQTADASVARAAQVTGNVSALRYTAPGTQDSYVYALQGSDLKESILVKSPRTQYAYRFTLTLEGLTAACREDGGISLSDGETEIFRIPAPYLYDAAGVYSTQASYTLTQQGAGNYLLVLTADAAWMNATERVYPVCIDPSLHTVKSDGADQRIVTQTISDDDMVNTHPGDDFFYVGYTVSDGHLYSHIKINTLPELPFNTVFSEARINLPFLTYSNQNLSSFRIYAQEALEDWGSQFAQVPVSNGNPILDYKTVSADNAGQYISFQVTEAARKWYDSSAANTGIVLYGDRMSASAYAQADFLGYINSGAAQYCPFFSVTFRNTQGLEDYYTYQTLDAGRAGNIYVSDYTGRMTLVHTDVSDEGFTLSHVYNSSYSDWYFTSNTVFHTVDYSKMILGGGWRLNAQQSVVPFTYTNELGESKEYLIYSDGDGTEHYFWNTTGQEYKDEDGLGLTITRSGSNYTMKDDENNQKLFVNGYLTKITDSNGNVTAFVYNSKSFSTTATTWYPSASGNKLTSIVQKNDGKTQYTVATLQYSGDRLISVTDRNGLTTSFSMDTYDSKYYMTRITEPDNWLMYYRYGGGNYKMSVAYDAESKIGQEMTYRTDRGDMIIAVKYSATTYNGTKTVQRRLCFNMETPGLSRVRDCGNNCIEKDGDDFIYTYTFDNYGRTISGAGVLTAGDTIGVTGGNYSANVSTNRTNNRVLGEASAGNIAQNLLRNGDFEVSQYWENATTVTGDFSNGYRTNDKKSGAKSMFMNEVNMGQSNTISQQVTIATKGKYTFSAYVKAPDLTLNENATDTCGVYLDLGDTASYIERQDVLRWETDSSFNDGWVRIATVVNIPTGGVSLMARVIMKNCVGSIYVDEAQLSKGEGESSFNYIQNSGFDRVPAGDSTTGNVSYPGANATQQHNDSWGGVIRLGGSPTSETLYSKTVPLALTAAQTKNTTFIFSGWAKANSVPINQDSITFQISAEIRYSDGSNQYATGKFNPDIHDKWQFICVPVVPRKNLAITSLVVHCSYKQNCNAALFDELSLTMEPCATYRYNSDGKVVAVNSSNRDEMQMTYSGADLISSTGSGSGDFTYTYDSAHNITRATNEGLGQSMTYDAAGNMTSTTLKGTASSDTAYMKTTATYTAQGDRVASVTDNLNNQTTYTYAQTTTGKTVYTHSQVSNTDEDNANTVTLTNVTDGAGRAKQTYISGVASVDYTYTKGNLTGVTRGGYISDNSEKQNQSYTFAYDLFGNRTSSAVGNRTLATYTYNNYQTLSCMTYGNGAQVNYTYDIYNRVRSKTASGWTETYDYDASGNISHLHAVKTDGTERDITYEYDSIGRLMWSVETDENQHITRSVENEYDSKNRLTAYRYSNGLTTRTQRFTYRADGMVEVCTAANGDRITNQYDSLKRLQKKTVEHDNSSAYTYEIQTTYQAGNETNRTTSLVQMYKYQYAGTNNFYATRYVYDNLGNIREVWRKYPNSATGGYHDEQISLYRYDDQNRLIYEENRLDGYTMLYYYDTYGNLRTKKKLASYGFTSRNHAHGIGQHLTTDTYTYGDESWKDLLTAYNGHAFTYDAIGNPLTYYNGKSYNMTWNGRQLSTLGVDGKTVSYTYDADGQRTAKTVGTDQTTYLYIGGQLCKVNSPTAELELFYDDDGRALGFSISSERYGYAKFYYVYNAQGDVVQLRDAANNVTANYLYDAWGKLLHICTYSGVEITDASDAALLNPIRYRGYVYDSETGLYYLNSRYYDPQLGRFVNADGYASTGQGIPGNNMFAYCGNNPVNRKDPTGQFWITALIVTAVVAVCTVALSGCSAQPSTPSNYVQENSTNQNCYSYAFDLPHSANPGDYSASGNSDYMFKDKNIYTPEEITGFIQRDMDALNKSVRVVDSPKDKLDNEYIVAMKTSTIVIPSIGVADYHFAVQLSDGSWADKPGQTPSRWNALDGAAIAWDLGNIKNYYNTETVYFAVER